MGYPCCCDGEPSGFSRSESSGLLLPTPYLLGSGSGSSTPLIGKDCQCCSFNGKLPPGGYTINVAGMIGTGIPPRDDCETWNASWVVDQQECPNPCMLVSPRVTLDATNNIVPGFAIDLFVQLILFCAFADLTFDAHFMYVLSPVVPIQLCGAPCDVALGTSTMSWRYTQVGDLDCRTPSGAAMSRITLCGGCVDDVGASVNLTANH